MILTAYRLLILIKIRYIRYYMLQTNASAGNRIFMQRHAGTICINMQSGALFFGCSRHRETKASHAAK